MEGLNGLFANLYDEKVIYVGRSSSQSHLFQESEYRYKSLKRGLIKLGVLVETIDSIDMRVEIGRIITDHFKKYVGIFRYSS